MCLNMCGLYSTVMSIQKVKSLTQQDSKFSLHFLRALDICFDIIIQISLKHKMLKNQLEISKIGSNLIRLLKPYHNV